MSDIPSEMLQANRKTDPHFAPNEQLFRRFAPAMLSGGCIGLDAIDLPDMSVARGKYGKPEWLLLQEQYSAWGVLAFPVREIPGPLLHRGVYVYTFRPTHRPLRKDYPHSEVWAFEDGKHIDGKSQLDPEVHLRWRLMLLRKVRIRIPPCSDR